MTTSSSDDTPSNICSCTGQEKDTDKDTSIALANAQELTQRAQELLTNVPPPSNQEQPQEQPMDLLQQALRIRQSVLGDSHAVVAETHCLIAGAWISQRHYALGLDHYGLALDILRNSSDESTKRSDTATTVSSLQNDISALLDTAVETANYSMQQGTEAQARQQPAEALEHFEYAHGLLGAVLKHSSSSANEEETKLNSLAFCDVCRVIASVHVSHSNYQQALAFLQQAHGVLEPLLGKKDPRTVAMASDVQTVKKLANHKRPDTAQDVLQWFEQEDYNNTEREDVVATQQDDDGDKPLGVSIDWIKRGFWEEIQAASLDPSATIQQVIDGVLIPKQQQSQESQAYVEQLDSQYTGPASLMLSYADQSTIADIVNTLDDYCRTQALDDRTVNVWMECLCRWSSSTSAFPAAEKKEEEKQSDPNDDPPQQLLPPEEEEALQTRISQIGHVLAILTPWFHPRMWNEPYGLQEISLAQHTDGCKLTLVLPPAENAAVSDALIGDPSWPIARLYQAMGELPVDQQRIFRPWIRNVIQAQVKEHCNPTEDNELQQTGSSRSLLSVASNSSINGETEEQAMDVFKLQLCNKMGLLFWQYGEYKTALELLEDALTMTESVYGESHESTATVYQNIANVLSDMGRYTMALETYLRALRIMETASQQQHPRIAGLCTKLGNLYRMTDQLNKAMEYHQRALTIQVKLHGSTHNLAAADCYKDMGNVFFSKGDNQAALMEFRKVLGIQQNVWQDKSHPTLAATHNQIGLVLQAKGDYVGALKEYRTAVSIQEEALGMDHVQTAMTYDNIASVLECQDDWEGALEISTKAQAIYRTCLGANHPTTAAAWHAMGGIQNELDQVEDSLQSYHKALAIRQSVLGMEHPQTAETLQSIGTILFEIGDLDEALVELRKAFDIVEPLLGIEHPTTKGLADTINAVLEA